MCQSSVWLRHPDGNTEKIADDVMIVRQEGPVVLFGGLFGGTMQITGTIHEIDAMKHTITLNVAEAEADQEPVQAPESLVEPSQRIIDVRFQHKHGHKQM